jgi:hypothetical protein
MVEYDNNFYNIEASPLDHPIKNIPGDIEIQLHNNNMTIFHTDTILCSTGSCSARCKVDQSAISRLKNNFIYKTTSDNIYTFKGDNKSWPERI